MNTLLLIQPRSQECTTTLFFSPQLLQRLYRWSVQRNTLSLVHLGWQIAANSRNFQLSSTIKMQPSIIFCMVVSILGITQGKKHGIEFFLHSHLWRKAAKEVAQCMLLVFFWNPHLNSWGKHHHPISISST